MTEDNPRVIVPPPLIFAALLALGLSIDRNEPTLSLPLAVGVLLIALGASLVAIALGLFRRSSTRAEPWKPSSALVVRGIYSWTRNPMYLGMASFTFGIALLFESVSGLLLVLVATIIIDRFVIRREEAYLIRRFGDEYRAYQGKVGRWL